MAYLGFWTFAACPGRVICMFYVPHYKITKRNDPLSKRPTYGLVAAVELMPWAVMIAPPKDRPVGPIGDPRVSVGKCPCVRKGLIGMLEGDTAVPMTVMLLAVLESRP